MHRRSFLGLAPALLIATVLPERRRAYSFLPGEQPRWFYLPPGALSAPRITTLAAPTPRGLFLYVESGGYRYFAPEELPAGATIDVAAWCDSPTENTFLIGVDGTRRKLSFGPGRLTERFGRSRSIRRA